MRNVISSFLTWPRIIVATMIVALLSVAIAFSTHSPLADLLSSSEAISTAWYYGTTDTLSGDGEAGACAWAQIHAKAATTAEMTENGNYCVTQGGLWQENGTTYYSKPTVYGDTNPPTGAGGTASPVIPDICYCNYFESQVWQCSVYARQEGVCVYDESCAKGEPILTTSFTGTAARPEYEGQFATCVDAITDAEQYAASHSGPSTVAATICNSQNGVLASTTVKYGVNTDQETWVETPTADSCFCELLAATNFEGTKWSCKVYVKIEQMCYTTFDNCSSSSESSASSAGYSSSMQSSSAGYSSSGFSSSHYSSSGYFSSMQSSSAGYSSSGYSSSMQSSSAGYSSSGFSSSHYSSTGYFSSMQSSSAGFSSSHYSSTGFSSSAGSNSSGF